MHLWTPYIFLKRTRRSRPFVGQLAWLIALSILSFAVLLGVAAAAGDSIGDLDMRQVDKLERFPEDARKILGPFFVPKWPLTAKESSSSELGVNGTLLPIPEVRQLWQIWNKSQQTAVAVRDFDSLKILHSFVLPSAIDRGSVGGASGEWMHAVDREGKRIFLSATTGGSNPVLTRNLFIVDLTTFTLKKMEMAGFPYVPTGGQPVFPTGFTWDSGSRRLWSLWGKGSSTLDPYSLQYLVSMNPDLYVRDGSEAVEGWRVLTGCKGPVPSGTGDSFWYSTKLTRYKEWLYIPCNPSAGFSAIAKIRVSSALQSNEIETLIAGPAEIASALKEEDTGRLHFILPQSEDWIFDPASESFIAVVALGGVKGTTLPTFSLGIDQDTRRLYLNSRNFGLGFTETRVPSIAQPRIWPELGGLEGEPRNSQEMIVVNSRAKRIFALSGISSQKSRAYRIFDVPSYPPTPLERHPDQNTMDIAEKEMITSSNFFGSASGYGIRVLLAGGIVKMVPVFQTQLLLHPLTGSPAALFTDYLNSKCGFADRELVAGRVSTADLTNYTSKAQSLGFFLDQRTQQNLLVPSQCDLESPQAATFKGIFGTSPQVGDALNSALGRKWKPAFAECSIPSSSPPEYSPGEPALGKASVRCVGDSENQTLTAEGFGQIAEGFGQIAEGFGQIEEPLVTGSGYSTVKINKDPIDGIVSKSEAVVRGLRFGSEDEVGTSIAIKEIRSEATSMAKGRPGSARSFHKITIKGYSGSDGYSCEQTCDVDKVTESLNAIFVGKATFRTGSEPDQLLLDGSPQGAQSAIQKSDTQRSSDQLLIGDYSNEVPGLEMTTYNDTRSWGRGRQVYQFAGVRTASTYNISKLSSGEGFGPDEDFFEEDPGSEEFIDDAFLDDSGAPLALLGAECDNSFGGRLARLAGIIWRNLKNAAAMGTVWLLLLSPLLIAGRRRLLRGISPVVSLGRTGALTLGRMSPQAKKLVLVVVALLLGGLALSLTSHSVAGASEVASPTLAADCFSAGVAGAARMLWREVKEALGMGTVWLLFLSPLLIAGRRRLLRTTPIPISKDWSRQV